MWEGIGKYGPGRENPGFMSPKERLREPKGGCMVALRKQREKEVCKGNGELDGPGHKGPGGIWVYILRGMGNHLWVESRGVT